MRFEDEYGNTGDHLYQVRVTRTVREHESAYITVAADSESEARDVASDMDSCEFSFECDDTECDNIDFDDVEIDGYGEREQFERLIGDNGAGNRF